MFPWFFRDELVSSDPARLGVEDDRHQMSFSVPGEGDFSWIKSGKKEVNTSKEGRLFTDSSAFF